MLILKEVAAMQQMSLGERLALQLNLGMSMLLADEVNTCLLLLQLLGLDALAGVKPTTKNIRDKSIMLSQDDAITPFQILGGEAQFVQIMLKPQEKVIARPVVPPLERVTTGVPDGGKYKEMLVVYQCNL